MKSSRPKEMHKIGRRPLLMHVLEQAGKAGVDQLALVLSPEMTETAEAVQKEFRNVQLFYQQEQRGTADAVLSAREFISNSTGDIAVVLGDAPLLRAETLIELRQKLGQSHDLAVLGFNAQDPSGYGRLVTRENGDLIAIREHNDATEAERQINFCNSGVLAFRSETMLELLDAIGNDNSKREFYLTDVVEIAHAKQRSIATSTADEVEVLGINTQAQLAQAENLWQEQRRDHFMAQGVSMMAPETVYLSFDTKIDADVTLEPNIVLGPGVEIRSGATIKAFSHLEGAIVGEKSTVGPFARLRPGANLGAGVRVGNFVEIKQAELGEGAKVNHLTYVGDSEVGSGANIGAGTITCNYDGFAKHKTIIGDGAFVGSNSSLVAPVTIGSGAYIGSGSVVSKNVPSGSLVVTRGALVEKEGWADRFRSRAEQKKKQKIK